MATSGSINYTQTRDQIISDALQLLGVIGSGQSVSANDLSFCSGMLNKMVKAWEGQGIHLWKEAECNIALRTGVNKYTLSSSGDKAGEPGVYTTTTADATTGATTIYLTTVTGISALDNIGIELDDDTRQWTTVASVDTNALSVTLNAALTEDASSGASVLTYTTIINRPLNITALRYKTSFNTEREIVKMGRAEFMQIPNKASTGPATCFYYSPQLNEGLLYVWPTPDRCEDILTASYLKTIEDFDSGSDNPDFPQEWLEALTFNLAVRVAPAYGLTLSKVNPDIIQTAMTSLSEIRAWDVEEGSVRVVPNYRWDTE